jgi:hypothetical protein
MSMTMAVVVMIVVIVIVGGAGYAALSAVSGSGTKTFSTCSPPNSPVCLSTSGLTDVVLSIPYAAGFGQAVATTAQGQSIPATVAVSGGESVSEYQIFWGDGSNYTGTNPTSNHVYTGLGWYVISAQALVGSTWHTGPRFLYPIDVTPSYQTTVSGFYPTLTTTLTNGSSAAVQFGWLSGAGTINISATYSSNSTATGYADAAPTLTSTGGSQSDLVSAPISVAASYSFNSTGVFYITMIGPVASPSGTIYQNYTWTIYVAPTGVPVGCGSCSSGSGSGARSPHTDQVVFDEVAPGGATTEDPSVAYDGTSMEPIDNVYQTLVQYNESSTASYLPVLSLCVPGPNCAAMFGGNSLVVSNATTGQPEYWTFPIDPTARFYDPSTGANWSVYPSDVAFTFSRTCGFVNLPGVGYQPGWIQCQALLSLGKSGWDSSIHFPFNNTPQGLLSSILINDSTYCPNSVMAHSNGCVTFNAWGGGAAWSFFLELVTDPLGAGIEPCGWFTAQGAAVPGFTGTTASGGDGSCLLPGGAHASSDPAFQSWLTTTPATYWDTFEEQALNTPGIQPAVQWNMVGSGPYYLTHQPFERTVGYTLAQNPAYAPPTGCKGQPNCEPLPGPSHYVAKVTVVYQQTDTVGIEQYKAGLDDLATIEPGETPQLLSLIQEGKINAFTAPSLSIFYLAFALEFDPAATKRVDPFVLNIPSDFFNYIGLRQFLVHAFPYSTVEATIITADGIQYGFNYGGVIPRGTANYYPTNISWPSGDPVSNSAVNGSAAWWWAQATTSGSPYYDPELGSCTTTSPCEFPIVGWSGEPQLDQAIQDYISFISSLSGGRLAPNTFDLTYGQIAVEAFSALAGQSALPTFNMEWTVDYPDPTDFVVPFYEPNATYTMPDAVEQGLDQFTCSASGVPAGMPADANSMAGLLFWANLGPISQACQGTAYQAMEYGMAQAAGMSVGPLRVLFYNLIEHIANQLALYVYDYQVNWVVTYAAWINPTTLVANPMDMAGFNNIWYHINGNGVLSS